MEEHGGYIVVNSSGNYQEVIIIQFCFIIY